jgi:hypothetical protein
VATNDGDRESRGRDRALTALFGLAVAFVVVAPLTRRGWLLLLDWVPGPRQVGATGGATLPTGPVFWWPVSAAHSIFGAAVGWLPLAVALALAAVGAAQLVGGPWAARVAAGVAYAWNPFVYDRIAVGQMSVLVGYALLPWLARSALRAKSWRGALVVGGWWAAVALCTLHFAWIGGLLVLCVAIARARELGAARVLGGFAITVTVAAAVIGLGVLGTHPSISPRGSVAVLTSFGTRSDPSLGRSVGILAQQGFWRSVVARPRDDLDSFFPVIAGASIAAAVFGLVLARGTARARLAASVAIAGFLGWLLAHGNAGPIGSLYRAMFEHAPGFGVMREAQKWVALVSLAIAVGTGCLAAAIARTRASLAAWAVVLLPIALAPTLAWGLSDRIEPVRYPSGWAAVRSAVDRVPGDVVVLPWEQYPMSVITGDRTIANPGPAYFGSRVITSRNPGVGGLPGDTGRRAAIAAAVDTARADAAAGRPVRLGAALARLGYLGVLEIGSPDVPLQRDTTLTQQAGADGVALWVVNPQR